MTKLRTAIETGDWNDHIQAVWVNGGKYVLYMISANLFEELSSEMDTITTNFSKFISSPNAHKARKDFREMTSLNWVNLNRLNDEKFKKSLSVWASSVFSRNDLKLWIKTTTKFAQTGESVITWYICFYIPLIFCFFLIRS